MFAQTARETLNFSRAATKNSAPGDSLISGAATVCVRSVIFPSRWAFIASTPSISSANRFLLDMFCSFIWCSWPFARRAPLRVPSSVGLSRPLSGQRPHLCRTVLAAKSPVPRESNSKQPAVPRVCPCPGAGSSSAGWDSFRARHHVSRIGILRQISLQLCEFVIVEIIFPEPCEGRRFNELEPSPVRWIFDRPLLIIPTMGIVGKLPFSSSYAVNLPRPPPTSSAGR